MAKLQEFRNIVKDYNGTADFAVVYIEEAHPSDGWFFKVRFLTLANLRMKFTFCFHKYYYCSFELSHR